MNRQVEHGAKLNVRRLAANIYIWGHVLLGTAVLCWTAATWQLQDRLQFFSYLLTAMVAAGLKVRLPGVQGTVSVAFLFAFIGILNLSTQDAVIIIAGCLWIQCIYQTKQRPRAIQVWWSIASNASGVFAAGELYNWIHRLAPEPVALAVLTSTFFVATTSSLAGVIALTEAKSFRAVLMHQKWLFPYYLCGTSVAWIIATMPRAIQWQLPIVCLPVIYVIHRSYTRTLAQMEQEKLHVEEVNSLHLRTIETLAVAIEARDHETHDHLARVQTYAVEVGRELGLSESELTAIHAASLLHDIGKLAVPERIIAKPGKLTPAEFEKMKIHPVVGAEILERVRFPYPVVPIVRSHHEKWNGTGYPDGLKGKEIPIGARILSAVDCLDALASDRPYRRALPLDEAMAKVASEAGTSFDPGVVDVLARKYRELESRAKECSQPKHAALSTNLRVERGAAPAAGFAVESGNTVELARLAQGIQSSQFSEKTSMLAEVTLRETAAVIGLRLQDQIPYDAFAFFDWDGAALHPLFVGGKHGDLFRGLKVPRREGLVGWVLENQKAIINGNPAVEPGYPQSAVHTLLSALAIPATTSDATQVVLALYRSNAEAFRDQELALARFLCSRVGLTVEETALPPSLTQVTPS